MRKYLDHGGNVDRIIHNGKMTLISKANSKEMAELLVRKGANLRILGDRGMTPILFQASRGNAEVIKVLLKADPKLIYDRSGFRDNRETLLHKCVLGADNKALECVKVLLAHEPKIDINGLTVYADYADEGEEEEFTPLDYAVQTDGPATKEIIKLLIDNGAIRHSTQSSDYDAFIDEYIASKKIGKFMIGVNSKRRTLHNAWRPPNINNPNNQGGEAYQALLKKVNISEEFSPKGLKGRKSRKGSKGRKSRKGSKARKSRKLSKSRKGSKARKSRKSSSYVHSL